MRPTTPLLPLLSSLLLLLLTPARAQQQQQQQAAAADTPAAVEPKTHTLTLYAQPLSSATPHLLASISYTYPTLNSSLLSYTPLPLSGSSSANEPAKLGFYRRSSDTSANEAKETWSGILTSAAHFTSTSDDTDTASPAPKRLKLYLDAHGAVWHVGFSTLPPAATLPQTAASAGVKSGRGLKAKMSAGAKKRGAKKAGVEEVEDKEKEQALVIELVAPSAGAAPVLNRPVVRKGKEGGKVGAGGEGGEEEEEQKGFFQKYWWAIAIFLVVQVAMGGGGDK